MISIHATALNMRRIRSLADIQISHSYDQTQCAHPRFGFCERILRCHTGTSHAARAAIHHPRHAIGIIRKISRDQQTGDQTIDKTKLRAWVRVRGSISQRATSTSGIGGRACSDGTVVDTNTAGGAGRARRGGVRIRSTTGELWGRSRGGKDLSPRRSVNVPLATKCRNCDRASEIK